VSALRGGAIHKYIWRATQKLWVSSPCLSEPLPQRPRSLCAFTSKLFFSWVELASAFLDWYRARIYCTLSMFVSNADPGRTIIACRSESWAIIYCSTMIYECFIPNFYVWEWVWARHAYTSVNYASHSFLPYPVTPTLLSSPTSGDCSRMSDSAHAKVLAKLSIPFFLLLWIFSAMLPRAISLILRSTPTTPSIPTIFLFSSIHFSVEIILSRHNTSRKKNDSNITLPLAHTWIFS